MATWKQRSTRWVVGAALLTSIGLVSWTSANTFLQKKQDVDPNTLVPASTFLYVQLDGMEGHREAFEKTAEYKAFYESGLAELFSKAVDSMVAQDESGNAEKARTAVNHLMNNGFLMAASLPAENNGGMPVPGALLVFPEAGKWVPEATQLLEMAMQQGPRIELQKSTMQGRDVVHFMIPDSPGLEFGMWEEGAHLVMVAGQNLIAGTLACADGEAPAIGTNEAWQKAFSAEVDFEQTGFSWFNPEPLTQTYGDIPLPLPSPRQVTVQDVVELTGLNQLKTISARNGYKGTSQWAETRVEGLARSNGKSLTLKDLPPLPSKMNWFSLAQFDAAGFYDKVLKMARSGAEFAGQNESEQLERMLQQLPQILGFDPKTDLIDLFGERICLYDDANGGVFGMGTGVCIALKDGEKMTAFLDEQLTRLEEAEENGEYFDWPVYPFRIEKDGRDMIVFDIYDDSGDAIQYGALQVVDNWLVIGWMPQTVEAFRLRVEGKLPTWKPTEEHEAALAELPSEFTSMTTMNTRDIYSVLLNWSMPFLPMLQKFALEEVLEDGQDLPFYVEDFPPPETVTSPLYPMVAVSVADETGTTSYSRASTYGIPMSGGNSTGATVAVAGVGVALLLPAVQQARTAARTTQSRNNMKQIGLSMHNYHDTYRNFPTGTVVNEDLKPEERLSWAYSVLPFLDEAWAYEQVNDEEKWNSESNDLVAQYLIGAYTNPNIEEDFGDYQDMHYAGICGVGKDAPELKTGHPRAGIFGYNREVRMRDITDGTSNTMMVTEVYKDFGPWMQGGNSTLRSLTKKPYVYGPDGIGGGDKQTVNVLMGDGSVRRVSKEIDPEIFEALSTMSGGEVVGEF